MLQNFLRSPGFETREFDVSCLVRLEELAQLKVLNRVLWARLVQVHYLEALGQVLETELVWGIWPSRQW